MRVLLDTNVIVSAYMAQGLCSEIYGLCLARSWLVTSAPLIRELEAVLVRKSGFDLPIIREIVDHMSDSAELISPVTPIKLCRDSNDDVVLVTAIDGECECVVTGDKDLLTLRAIRGIPILNPRDFWLHISTMH